MPRNQKIKKVLVIGSGPIVIGQAAEFDYAGTQACRSLKEEGVEVVLVNSNPATIMTDKEIADEVYIEPLTVPVLEQIIAREKPDSILPTLGGQAGLNLGMELSEKGILEKYNVNLIGTTAETIFKAEDRQAFKDTMEKIGEPCAASLVVNNVQDGIRFTNTIGYPVVLRPAFTLGGSGGGIAHNETELIEILTNGLRLSRVGEVLVERCIAGWKEIEYEVMRDAAGNCITVCNMENIDPVGVHTGDSIVVAPSQTLGDKEYQMLRTSALNIISELNITGGCNVQYALHPETFEYCVIEVNPRVSRSSALASKATGYPIAKVAAKIALGYTLDEIKNAITGKTYASFEPALDYCVVKLPRLPFDKFITAKRTLTTQMKATGEVMSVGRTFEESLLKGIRSLETGQFHLHSPRFDGMDREMLLSYIKEGRDDRIYAMARLLRLGCDPADLGRVTGIDLFFIRKMKKIVDQEGQLEGKPGDRDLLLAGKKMGFSDREMGCLWGMGEEEIFGMRKAWGIFPVYKMIDTCASEFDSYIPYFYSTYEEENESVVSDRKKIVVLGSGPIRIGQGVEFDYSTVHAVKTIQKAGYEAIIINNNPETVSTDYTCSDKLYFEPLCAEDVLNVIELEHPQGVIATLGGQTAINLAEALSQRGVTMIGTGCEAIARAEDRDLFEKLLRDLGIHRPKGRAVTTVEEGVKAAGEIGYPVLVRPSFVLGGRAMEIVAKEEQLRHYLKHAAQVNEDKPVLVDRYIRGREVEVDAVCDGKQVFVPGIMELVERTGIHSGDSISVYPSVTISPKVKEVILDYTRRLGLAIGIVGLFNIQFIVDEQDQVYLIEVNPRSSRTVPFLSKATGCHLADIATLVMLGRSLKDQGILEMYPKERSRYYVKVPAFSFSKLDGMDAYLSPEMKSTGEAIGYDKKLHRAMYKAMIASGMTLNNYGTVMVTLASSILSFMAHFLKGSFSIRLVTGLEAFRTCSLHQVQEIHI